MTKTPWDGDLLNGLMKEQGVSDAISIKESIEELKALPDGEELSSYSPTVHVKLVKKSIGIEAQVDIREFAGLPRYVAEPILHGMVQAAATNMLKVGCDCEDCKVFMIRLELLHKALEVDATQIIAMNALRDKVNAARSGPDTSAAAETDKPAA